MKYLYVLKLNDVSSHKLNEENNKCYTNSNVTAIAYMIEIQPMKLYRKKPLAFRISSFFFSSYEGFDFCGKSRGNFPYRASRVSICRYSMSKWRNKTHPDVVIRCRKITKKKTVRQQLSQTQSWQPEGCLQLKSDCESIVAQKLSSNEQWARRLKSMHSHVRHISYESTRSGSFGLKEQKNFCYFPTLDKVRKLPHAAFIHRVISNRYGMISIHTMR